MTLWAYAASFFFTFLLCLV